jgi:hypothetical protein
LQTIEDLLDADNDLASHVLLGVACLEASLGFVGQHNGPGGFTAAALHHQYISPVIFIKMTDRAARHTFKAEYPPNTAGSPRISPVAARRSARSTAFIR